MTKVEDLRCPKRYHTKTYTHHAGFELKSQVKSAPYLCFWVTINTAGILFFCCWTGPDEKTSNSVPLLPSQPLVSEMPHVLHLKVITLQPLYKQKTMGHFLSNFLFCFVLIRLQHRLNIRLEKLRIPSMEETNRDVIQ